MDFAALMSAQIAKAKGDNLDSSKKYIKNSEAEANRVAAYEKEQAELAAAREAKAAAKRKREDDAAAEAKAREEKRARLAEESRRRREEQERVEEAARRKRLGLPELPDGEGAPAAEEDEDEDEDAPGDAELTERLRGLGEPAALFGETRALRLRRFRRLTTALSGGPIPTSLQLVEEKDMKVPETVPADRAGQRYLYRQLASYFTMVLREWEAALEKEGRHDTLASRAAYSAMAQSKETMKPVRWLLPPFCLVVATRAPY
jgi:pre-mRNA-splicing factor 18